MKVIQFKVFSVLIILGLFFCPFFDDAVSQSGALFDDGSRNTIYRAVKGQKIVILPQINPLNFGFGRINGSEYYFMKSLDKIFFYEQPIVVEVIEVEFMDMQDEDLQLKKVVLDLKHPILGFGTLEFVFNHALLSEINDREAAGILLRTLSHEDNKYLFCNQHTRTCHLNTCNFLQPKEEMIKLTPEEAEKQNFKKCTLCFKKIHYIPERSLELAIERSWSARMRGYELILEGSEQHRRLQLIGERLIANYPYPLLGYDYSFHLAKSPRLHAFAIPTGKIVITTSLMDALESDGELEALLLIAIANIERRHALKEYLRISAKAENAKIMKTFANAAGAIAGPFTGGVSAAVRMVPFPDGSEFGQPAFTYDIDYVKEADAIAELYFEINGKDKQKLITLIKKLQFNEFTEILNPDTEELDIRFFRGRIETIEAAKSKYFGKHTSFVHNGQHQFPVQFNLFSQRIASGQNTIVVYLSDKALLQTENHTSASKTVNLVVNDANGSHQFALNDNLSTEDMWGVHLTFDASASGNPLFLENIQSVSLQVSARSATNDRQTESQFDTFQFTKGEIRF